MSARYVLLLVGGLCGVAAAADAEPEVPDADFLEYLGMWEESDDEWLLHDEMSAEETSTRTDPAPEGEESAETEDES